MHPHGAYVQVSQRNQEGFPSPHQLFNFYLLRFPTYWIMTCALRYLVRSRSIKREWRPVPLWLIHRTCAGGQFAFIRFTARTRAYG